MLSEVDATIIRLGAHIVALEQALREAQAALAAEKAKSVVKDSPKK